MLKLLLLLLLLNSMNSVWIPNIPEDSDNEKPEYGKCKRYSLPELEDNVKETRLSESLIPNDEIPTTYEPPWTEEESDFDGGEFVPEFIIRNVTSTPPFAIAPTIMFNSTEITEDPAENDTTEELTTVFLPTTTDLPLPTTTEEYIPVCRTMTTEGDLSVICDSSDIKSVPRKEITGNLTVLRISETRIVNLRPFDFLHKHIEALVLESNSKLRWISKWAFWEMSGLAYLKIKGSIWETADYQRDNFFAPFTELSDLQFLFLESNRIHAKEVGAKKPTFTENLDPILPCLKMLSLKGNPLEVIEKHFFVPLKDSSLETLDLTSCSLEHIYSDAFEPLKHLKALQLMNNFKLFQAPVLGLMPRLSLQDLGDLQVAGFGSNMLTEVPHHILSQVNESLINLDLSQNVFIELGGDAIAVSASAGFNTFPPMGNLQELNLDSCRIQSINWQAFYHLPKLRDLRLNKNVLFKIPAAAMKPSVELLSMEMVAGMFDDGERFTISEGIFTQSNMSKLSHLSITNAKFAPIRAETFEGLDNLLELNLDYAVFDYVDEAAFERLPNLQSLSLYSAVGFQNVPLGSIIGQNKLESLDLTNILICSDDSGLDFLFQNAGDEEELTTAKSSDDIHYVLDSVKILNLTGSLINMDRPLDVLALDNMPKLRVLNMTQNRITSWNTPKFKANRHLEMLLMSDNYDYINLTPAMLEDFAGLKTLDFSRSLFTCNEFIAEFIKMVDEAENMSVWNWSQGYGYQCRTKQTGARMSFRDFVENGADIEEPLPDRSKPINYAKLVFPILSGFVLVLAFALFANGAYRNRWYFQYQLAKRRVRMERKGLIGDEWSQEESFCEFDAFVSYNREDRDLVFDHLLPGLEHSEPNLKLCVHERDFVVGRSIIENIVSSLEASKTCIIVLSKNYAKSEWCRFEAQMALQLFQEDERTNKRIIVIVRDKIPGSHLSKTLKTIVKLRTYLEWADKPPDGSRTKTVLNNETLSSFFKRLRFALGFVGVGTLSRVSTSESSFVSQELVPTYKDDYE